MRASIFSFILHHVVVKHRSLLLAIFPTLLDSGDTGLQACAALDTYNTLAKMLIGFGFLMPLLRHAKPFQGPSPPTS